MLTGIYMRFLVGFFCVAKCVVMAVFGEFLKYVANHVEDFEDFEVGTREWKKNEQKPSG